MDLDRILIDQRDQTYTTHIIIFQFNAMEALSIVPVQSLVPVLNIQPFQTIEKKYWHLIYSGELMFPHLNFSLRVSFFMVWWNGKAYISMVVDVIPMINRSQFEMDCEDVQDVLENECPLSIQSNTNAIPLGYYAFELPACARCTLGFQCHAHKIFKNQL